MAYRNFADDLVPGELATTGAAAPVTSGLGAIEYRVLLLSQRDGRSSAFAAGRARRITRRAFALDAPNALADPRLEALRRFAVLLRHDGEALRPAETERLHEAGYSARQVAEIRGLIAAERTSRRHCGKAAQPAGSGFALLVTLLALVPLAPVLVAAHA